MNFYEREISILTERIKKIESNPDPNRLRANKMYYELERESRIDQWNAWKAGKPFFFGRLSNLAKAMGFYNADGFQLSNRRTAHKGTEVRQNLRRLRGEAFPYNCCDGTLMGAEIILSGEIPKPSLIVDDWGCDSTTFSTVIVAHLLDIPMFHFDTGLEVNEDSMKYAVNQLHEFIEFAESHVPGIKYSEEKLAELQDIDHRGDQYFRDLYELRKRVPCPLPARDAMRLPRRPSYYPDPQKGIEWLKIYRDELYERAEKGVSSVNNERLRLMWTVTAPLYRNVFKKVEEMGVAVPIVQTALVSEFFSGFTLKEANFGRKLSPLEEITVPILCLSWGGTGKRWIDDTLATCRDMKVDAIVNFLQQGCTPTLGIKYLLADRAEKELNIPTLQIEGAYHDPEYINDAEFDSKLEEFINMCISRKESQK